MANKYFKRRWEESTGEELTDDWGSSVYYFETDNEYNVLRQLQVFDNGYVLKYDMGHMEDEYGGLSDQLPDTDDSWDEHTIDEDEFEDTWEQG